MRTATTLGTWIFAGWLAGGMALAQQSAPADHAASDKPVSKPTTSPARHVAHKARRHTTYQAATGAEAPTTANAAAADVPRLATPKAAEDPISLGMKWNGSNDDARQTRIQNYDGNATGTGAEVGLKLHF